VRASSFPPDNAPISTVGITTADRPLPLDRCLRSVVRQLDDHQRPARIVVVDASRSATNESRSRAVVSSIRRTTDHDITFAGRSEVQAIRRALRSIIEPPLVDLVLRPGAAGNRNLIILSSRGENVLLLDDDVVCDVWRPRSLARGFGLCGHIEERGIAFYRTRAAVCERLVPATVGLLDVHERALGRTVKALADTDVLEVNATACGHMRRAARGHPRAQVRMTFSGIAGDAGVNYPDRFLFSTGRWATVLKRSRRTLDTAVRYREICKIANRYLLMHQVSCMAACMGLSNRSLVPPFLPVGRNEDGLFGAMLSAMDPSTVSCHVPYAVLHDSGRPPRYAIARFPSARETRSADLLISLVHLWVRSANDVTPQRRLARLGEWLRDLAGLEPREFVDAVTVAVLATRERELARIETMVASGSGWPAFWRQTLRAYRRELLKNLQLAEFPLPIEFHGAPTRAKAWKTFQQFVGGSAELLMVWPSLWRTARTTFESF
jgi:hypothetical protein